jgi:hypothetical protein
MKKFRANYGTKIEEFEITKETDKQVVYTNEMGCETREAKVSDCASWHNSKEDAVNFLISKEQAKIDEKLKQVQRHKDNMNKIYALL